MVKEPRTVEKPTLAEVPKPKETPPAPKPVEEREFAVYVPPSQQGCQFPAPKPGEPIRTNPATIAPQVGIRKGPKVREA